MPEESSTAMQSSLLPPRRRQPPPQPPSPDALSGPPSIGLDDAGRHNELDLGGGGSSLQLDYMADAAVDGHAQPPPEIAAPQDSGLEFLAPSDIKPSESGIDLPSPVGVSRSEVSEGSNAYALDLPTPIAKGHAPPPRFAPPPPASASSSGPSFTDDLPTPVEQDLPTPVAAGGRFVPPADPAIDLPTPVVRGGATPPPADGFDLPIPDDLPAPGGQQLQPMGQQLQPAGQQLQPAGQQLQPTGQQLQPAGQQVQPAGLEMQPSELSVTPSQLDVTPANLDMRPKLGGDEVAPHDLPTPLSADAGIPQSIELDEEVGPGTERSDLPGLPEPPLRSAGAGPALGPAPTAARPAVSRGVLIGGGVLLLLGLAAGGVLYSGILDVEDPQPASLSGRGIPRPAKGQTNETPDTKATPSTAAAAERSPAIQAALAQHTPAAYLEVLANATKAGDGLAAAEAALLLDLHFGPNPLRVDEARVALQPYASSAEHFVRRVLGLVALANGQLDAADKALVGDEPRTRLYRGWLRLAQGKTSDAKTEADAVLAALPDEVAAR
ncbi:MAG: hypothetical protein K0V04_05260, partial [Deltaproteobacteria bacterium]|nr:hypothetical protein [Deltaproteobacteria bacterium]